MTKIVEVDIEGDPFIRVHVINNSRHIAEIKSDQVYNAYLIKNNFKKRIEAKLDKSIVLDRYDPITNTLVFYTT